MKDSDLGSWRGREKGFFLWPGGEKSLPWLIKNVNRIKERPASSSNLHIISCLSYFSFLSSCAENQLSPLRNLLDILYPHTEVLQLLCVQLCPECPEQICFQLPVRYLLLNRTSRLVYCQWGSSLSSAAVQHTEGSRKIHYKKILL